ncbi:MAG: tetratricopeptide repeat protein [Deltaproteobacteria bacterium]|nr:tetratricopeptide repeat protein [Deltaproteobacteria bacterium]
MTNNTNTPEGYIKKETMWFVALVALAFGFLSGIVFSVYKSGTPTSAPVSQQSAQQQSQPQIPDAEITKTILALEKEVLANPGNIEAWTQLGNYYFDSEQFSKAIEAYNKSLALNPNDANVLTDLGVMYRLNGNPAQAIASFDKAITLNPDHTTARFNRGIVLFYDLKDREAAMATWEELVKLHPDAKAPNGQLVSEIITSIKTQ